MSILQRQTLAQADVILKYGIALEKCLDIINDIDKILKTSGEHMEGNYFYIDGQIGNLNQEFTTKRYNLFHYASSAKNILEIGFNAGHSCILYLLANDYSKIQLFDLGCHTYAKHCFNYLDKMFPGRLSIIWGDTLTTLPMLKSDHKFDLIHIDGGHESDILLSDIKYCSDVSDKNTILIIDDISFHPEHMIKNLTSIIVDKMITYELIQIPSLFFSNFHFIASYGQYVCN
jgi:hypothetical protein